MKPARSVPLGALMLLQACAGRDPLGYVDDGAEGMGLRLLWQHWEAEREPWIGVIVGEDGGVEVRWKPSELRKAVGRAMGLKAEPEGAASGKLQDAERVRLTELLKALPAQSWVEPVPAGISGERGFRPEGPAGRVSGSPAGALLLVPSPAGPARRFRYYPGESGSFRGKHELEALDVWLEELARRFLAGR